MTLDQNLIRWINASFAKFFDSQKQTLDLWIEGQDRDIQNLSDVAEFRLTGPDYDEYTQGCFELMIQVNVLVTCAIDKSDLYKIHRDVGIATQMFQSSVPIYKYGTSEEDDQSLIDCFTRTKDVRVQNYGQLDPNIMVQQTSIESSYRMIYDTTLLRAM